MAVVEEVEVSDREYDLRKIVAMIAKNYGAKECYGLDISSH